MGRLRVDVSALETEILFRHFNKNGDAGLDLSEFRDLICGPMNTYRRDLVGRVFRALSDGEDKVGIGRLRDRFDASSHPDVIARRRTKNSVVEEFENAMAGNNTVDLPAFEQYYSVVSFAVEKDQKFLEILKTVWRLRHIQHPTPSGAVRRV